MTGNFAICRTKKMKTKGNIGGQAAHVERTSETLNANSKIKNLILKGTGNMLVDYEARMCELNIPKIRKNAVLAVDFMLTASPDFFQKNGKRDREKTVEFIKAANNWLQKKWGDDLVSVTAHFDEKTPHIHALIIPAKDGKLNARHFFGGREKMSALQDDFYQAVSHLGLDRGLKNSKAEHQKIQKYYTKVNKIEEVTSGLNKAQSDLEGKDDEIRYLNATINSFKGEKAAEGMIAAAGDLGDKLDKLVFKGRLRGPKND